jgi:hypothetical protein
VTREAAEALEALQSLDPGEWHDAATIALAMDAPVWSTARAIRVAEGLGFALSRRLANGSRVWTA